MLGKGAVHVTLSLLTRIACVAAVAALLLPALGAGAWAADVIKFSSNYGFNWVPYNPSSPQGHYQAGVGKESGDAIGGSVTIDTGNSTWAIYGGYTHGGGSASGNTATMNSGNAQSITGGYSGTSGGSGNAFYNTVHINGGTVTVFVDGGHSFGATANNNTVILSGSPILSNATIRGGRGGNGGNSKSENNTVILSGTPTLTNANIRGGGDSSDASKTFNFNTLILGSNTLGGYKGTSTVNEVKNFEIFKFVLEEDSQPLLVKDITFGNGQGKPSKVGSIDTTGSYDPMVGEERKLISWTTVAGGSDIELAADVEGKQLGGANAVTYIWDVDIVGQDLVAELVEKIDGGIWPQTKSLLEGRMGGTVTLTQAADLLAGQGMSAMLSSVSQSSFSTWGTVGGGTSRYNTGSHINSDGIGFMVGAAWRKCTGPGTLTLSPFFAFGWGNYTSHNSFAGVGSVKGKGNTNYQGGGLMARYSHTNTGWYGEASLSLGHVKQDFKTSDFLDNYLNDTKYAINQMYTSAHIGIGKEIALSNCSVLDVYGKYFWTHTGKKNVDVTGDDYRFAAVNSHRARFGARYTHTLAKGSGEVKPYAGAAYEYEFNGKGRGTVDGYRIADTRLQGSTGLLEAGIDYAPNSKKWALNAGITGFVGKRRGIMGQLGIRADF